MKKKYKVLFSNLNGTLIDTISGEISPKGIWDMKLKFNVLDAIKKLSPDYVFIVSNQGGIEKGFVERSYFESKCEFICNSIREYANINSVTYSYCSTNIKSFYYRMPNKGALETFRYGYKVKKEDCLMIGSTDIDKKTAQNFGVDYLDVNEFAKQYNDEG